MLDFYWKYFLAMKLLLPQMNQWSNCKLDEIRDRGSTFFFGVVFIILACFLVFLSFFIFFYHDFLARIFHFG
jgi:hypothetical protein